MTRKGWTTLLALAVALLLAVGLARRPARRASEVAAPEVEAGPGGEQAAREAATAGEQPSRDENRPSSAAHAADDRRRAFELGRRVFLPPPPGSQPAPASHHPRALDPGAGGPTDRRENPGPDSARVMSELHDRIVEIRASAAHCLDDWPQADPSLEAGIVLSIGVDERGLKEVWINDHDEVPSGPLACLSNAVYPIDWSGLTKDPMKLTVRIGYARDGGAASSEGATSEGGPPT